MRRLQTRFNVIFNVAMSSSVEAVFTSVGCNRSPGSLRWLPSSSTDLVAFGASCLVAVMDPSKASIRCTLRGHDCHTTVNCVSWSTSTAGTHQLISGASDGSLIEWDIDLNSFEVGIVIASPSTHHSPCFSTKFLSASRGIPTRSAASPLSFSAGLPRSVW